MLHDTKQNIAMCLLYSKNWMAYVLEMIGIVQMCLPFTDSKTFTSLHFFWLP